MSIYQNCKHTENMDCIHSCWVCSSLEVGFGRSSWMRITSTRQELYENIEALFEVYQKRMKEFAI